MAWIDYQIANQISPFDVDFSFDDIQKSKCSRDTGYFIDALIYDLLYGGNSQSLSAANAYFLKGQSFIPNEELQTIAAYTYLKTIIGDIVLNNLIIPKNVDLIQYTFLPAGSTIASTQLQQLLDDIIAVINQTSPLEILPIYENGVNFTSLEDIAELIKITKIEDIKNDTVTMLNSKYNLQSICERDIGYIIDAVSQDILLGGNSQSIDAAVTYYNSLGFVANSEAIYTADAFSYAKELAVFIIKNANINLASPYPYQTVITQFISNNVEFVKGAIAEEALKRNFDIIIDIIQTGLKDRYIRYQGTALFAATGVSADDVKESTEIEEVIDNLNGTYTIKLNKPTVGIGSNSTLYFGQSDVYPLTDKMVEDRCVEYGFDINAWDQRKYDSYGSMGGMLIDGAVISDNSPIRSFVADAFTQVNQGGRGVRATRRGYVQLVSVFTIFNSISVQADSGAIMSITNANANFGDYCMIAKGYGPKEFSGTIYNPAELPLYPTGKYPLDGNVKVFVPDVANRPHISLIMEVEPTNNYLNAQDKPGFLTATVTTNEIVEGSLTIDNIEVFNMHIGQRVYVKDQFGSYNDAVLDQPYLLDDTFIVDIGPSKIYLNKPVNRGWSDPNNPAFFTIFTCGKAYYTVLTSSTTDLPIRSDGTQLQEGDCVIPGSIFDVNSQKYWEVQSIELIKSMMPNIIAKIAIAPTYQSRDSSIITAIPQTVSNSYLATNNLETIVKIESLFDIILEILRKEDYQAVKDYKNSLVISKKLSSPTRDDGYAAKLILANLDFIAAEISSYLNLNMSVSYNKDKCIRDVKLICKNISEDLLSGGNYNSVYSGLSYYAVPNTYHVVSLNDNVRDSGLFQDGIIVNFYQRSYITASGYLFEYVGAGSNYGALPMVGRADPIQGREVNMLDGGKVFFTSTDQNGDFRIGPGLVINQAAGVLSGRTFQKSLFAEMTPFILALE